MGGIVYGDELDIYVPIPMNGVARDVPFYG